MAQKPLTYILLVLLIGGGFVVGSFFGGFIKGFTVPTSHKRIVDKIKIAFNIEGQQPIYTTPECVQSNVVSWGIQTTPLNVFTQGKEYQYSIWLWKSQDEVQYVMQIWGPDDVGKGYDIQLMRNYAPPFTLTYDGQTIIQAVRTSGEQVNGNVYTYPNCLYAFGITEG